MRVKRIEKVDKNCRRNKMFPVYEQKKENVHILQKTSRHAPPHLHNSVEFIYVISGSMEIGMGQELFHMDEGDFAVIFPDVIHHYQVFEKGKNKSIYVWALPVITSNYMDTLQNLCPVDPVIKKADLHPDIKYVLQALLQQKNISKEKKEEIQNTSENVLEERSVEQAYIQILLARSLGKMKLMDKKSVESNDIVYQAVSYIAKHFREDLSLEKISKELGVNKFTLSRVFSGIFHKNFKQYINEHRLNYASATDNELKESISIAVDTMEELKKINNNDGMNKKKLKEIQDKEHRGEPFETLNIWNAIVTEQLKELLNRACEVQRVAGAWAALIAGPTVMSAIDIVYETEVDEFDNEELYTQGAYFILRTIMKMHGTEI